MKHHELIVVGLLVFVALTGYAMAFSITCDGDMSDWNLSKLNDPTSNWSDNVTWLPYNGIAFQVEDNHNPLSGSPYKGVHIRGVGSSYTFYNEPKTTLKSTGVSVWEPYGDEPYDLEAYYFCQDSQNIYVAIITSVAQGGNPPGGGDRWPGDLALSFRVVPGEEYDCEYGVKLNLPTHGGNYQVGDIVLLPNWQGIGYTIPIKADIMILPVLPGGGVVGSACVHYVEMDHDDRGYPNYFIEVAIPKSVVGVTSASIQNVQYNDNCLNDHLFVPEFPAFSLLIGMIFGLAGIIYIVQSRNSNK